MKFKYIIAAFNIIFVFLLCAIFLAPLVLFEATLTVMFWHSVWPVFLVLFAVLAVMDVFFMLNYRLFTLLEREDWPAISHYLEQEVLRNGRFSSRRVRLLINAYLISGEPAAVLRLEKRTAAAKPALVEEHAPAFGAARILAGDPKGAADFFEQRLATEKAGNRIQNRQWLHWYYGFSLLKAGETETAGEVFNTLAQEVRAGFLVPGLSVYFLAKILPPKTQAEYRRTVEESRERIGKNRDGWKKEAAQMETEVYAAVVKEYIDKTGAWLFTEEPG